MPRGEPTLFEPAVCACGALATLHPTKGYSDSGACLKALESGTVKTPCAWPGCTKRVVKNNLGDNFCGPHKADDYAAFMEICRLEGPSGLSRHHPTIAERFEMSQTGKLPASRLTPVTFEDSHIHCGLCGAGLIVMNDADWSPDLPNSMSCRDGNKPWGIPICQCCSFAGCQHCLWHGVMVMGHTDDAQGVCVRCGRKSVAVAAGAR